MVNCSHIGILSSTANATFFLSSLKLVNYLKTVQSNKFTTIMLNLPINLTIFLIYFFFYYFLQPTGSHFVIFHWAIQSYTTGLFELMLYVPVNSNGNVGTLPPFYGTFIPHHDVMTLKMVFIITKTTEIFKVLKVKNLSRKNLIFFLFFSKHRL